jgi:hypothetical protein
MAYGPMCIRSSRRKLYPLTLDEGTGDGPVDRQLHGSRDCRALPPHARYRTEDEPTAAEDGLGDKARSESHTKAMVKVRLLECRAADLSIQIEELERGRDCLGGPGTDVLDLRALLARGGRRADLSVISLESAA